jgi:hypothetical protein
MNFSIRFADFDGMLFDLSIIGENYSPSKSVIPFSIFKKGVNF